MADASPVVAFLSDYGLADEFVGIVHLVVSRLAPAARMVDLTHQIPAHDVRAGAMTLWRTAPWLTPGVVLAVVDPGVGAGRRDVAIEVAGTDVVFVGPDNGLLLPAVRRLGGPSAAVGLSGVAAAGRTFAGRDVLAPAAARLAAGEPLPSLGPDLDPATLIEDIVIPEPVVVDGSVGAEVLWIDHFGNAQLNVPGRSGPLHLGIGAAELDVAVVGSYAELDPGQVGLVVDSYGYLSICRFGQSAASTLGLDVGDRVTLAGRDTMPSWVPPAGSPKPR